MDDIPSKLRRLWGKCVTSDQFVQAKTDKQAFHALEAWVKLKSVLVLPVKGGANRKHSRFRFHKKRMLKWIAGNMDECWNSCLAIEKDRRSHKQRTRSHNRKSTHPRIPKHGTNSYITPARVQRKHLRTRRLVNHGEMSKAMGALLSHGTADTTNDVLAQLREKHPQRHHTIVNPGPYPGWSRLTEEEGQIDNGPDIDDNDN